LPPLAPPWTEVFKVKELSVDITLAMSEPHRAECPPPPVVSRRGSCRLVHDWAPWMDDEEVWGAPWWEAGRCRRCGAERPLSRSASA
jgi:hypothetical protein